MSKRFISDTYTILILALALITVIALWQLQESPQQAYERGKIDGQLLDTMKPYVTMGIASPSEIVRQIVDGDTLYFWKQQVDTGYVLKPLYRVRKLWVPEDSMESCEYEEWLDTSMGWHGWEISEKLVQGWYDGVDTTYNMYEEAVYNWAMSYLLRERKYVIYFDSTEGCYMIQEENGD